MMLSQASPLHELAERLPIGVCIFSVAGETIRAGAKPGKARTPLKIAPVDAEPRVTYANAMSGLLFGSPAVPGETRGELIARLGPGCVGLAQLPTGSRMVVVAGGRLLEVESQVSDGGLLWLVVDSSVELRLHSRMAEEASFLAHSHEAFLVVDQLGFIRYANKFSERERGYDHHGLVGVNLESIERLCGSAYEDPRAQGADELRERLRVAVRDGGPVRYTAWHLRRDGGELPVEASMRPYRISNDTVLLITARDESRRLMHLQALIQAKAEAEAANRSKSAFMAITSHELRTPLTGIIGFCELLQLELPASAEAAQRSLKLIAESSQSLLGIVNDIVDLSKIESRTLEVRSGACDPDQVIDLTVQLWRERAKAKGLRIVRHPSVGAAARMTTDAQRLRQMLDNLMSNAVKFTSAGAIDLRLEHQPDHVEFSVTDTGCGIPDSAREHLFQAFWQASDHTTRGVGGNGLGLYLTRSLADLLGGKAWLHATGKQGSTFKLRLPRAIASRGSGRILKSDAWTGATIAADG